MERAPSIGGHMAQFDKTFPTLDCAACISTPKMVAVSQERNINLMTYSEVTEVKGFIGNYTVTVKRKPRYINENLCTGCGLCIEKCPKKVASEFEEGIGMRKASTATRPRTANSGHRHENSTFFQGQVGSARRTVVGASTYPAEPSGSRNVGSITSPPDSTPSIPPP